MFRRPRHNAIRTALQAFDAQLLLSAECYFGGGTAIVLALGEYRESVDIDFLCASKDGYRLLRENVWERGLPGLLRENAGARTLREVRSDQYGIRTAIEVDGFPIKLEFIREARVDLDGEFVPSLQIAQLRCQDMYAEKLLANSDRWNDNSVLSRDVIDLSFMISRWGPIPEQAWKKASGAYGASVRQDYERAVEKIRDRQWLLTCMEQMEMDHRLVDEILSAHN